MIINVLFLTPHYTCISPSCPYYICAHSVRTTHAVLSFVELTRFLFTVPGVKAFLSRRLSQDPLEQFFGCVRQRGGVHDNPNVVEFLKNSQVLRVVNSCKQVVKGNCRGNQTDNLDQENTPLPRRKKNRLSTCTHHT